MNFGTAEIIRAIIAERALLKPEDVSLDADPVALGLDSIGMVETIFAIEEAFNIAVPFNANAPETGGFDISSIGGIIRSVEGLIAARAA
jgi:acyl carrier protein